MEINVKDFGGIIKKSWIIILVLFIVATVLGYVISNYVLQKEYKATAMLIVSTSVQTQDNNMTTMTISDYDLNAKLVNSYSVLSKSDRVLSQVRNKLGIQMDLDKLSEKIDVSSKEGTDIISISVRDVSPLMAQSIANTLVDVFRNEVMAIMKMDNVQVIDSASLPNKPYRPNILVNTVACGLIGLVIAMIISVMRYTLDDTIKESDLITQIMEVPVIGNVPKCI